MAKPRRLRMIEPTRCPWCGTVSNAAYEIDSNPRGVADHLSICMQCGEISEDVGSNQRIKLEGTRLLEAMADPSWGTVQRAWESVQRARRAWVAVVARDRTERK